MAQETYNYKVEISLLNDDYSWTPVEFFFYQNAEYVSPLVVQGAVLEEIESGLKDANHRFFAIGGIILDSDSIKGVLVKVKE